MRKVALTGASGFLGKALRVGLSEHGIGVDHLHGDVRDPRSFERVDHTYDAIFHFGAPSSQILFARNPKHCIDVTLNGFMNAMNAAERSGAVLVYPSTGLLSMGGTNLYASCKAQQEAMAKDRNTVGVRIFATYGASETHKRDYASIPHAFAMDILSARQPEIWGDGSQTRDFIYISDAVEGIISAAEHGKVGGVHDIGSGVGTSVNEVYDVLFSQLSDFVKTWTDPKYIGAPSGYQTDTLAYNSLGRYWEPRISFEDGVNYMVTNMKDSMFRNW